MGSFDRQWTIERYPEYRDTESGRSSVFIGYSYGCPDLGLMGYLNISDLLRDIFNEIRDEVRT